MRHLTYLSRSFNFLNIILMTVIVLLINYAVFPFIKTDIKYTLPLPEKIVKNGEEGPAQRQNPSFTEFTIIAEQNPFHPERVIPVEKREEKPLPMPEIVLYGTVIINDIRLAYIEDKKSPVTTPGRGKRVRVVKKGQEISGFILKEIMPDNIVMVRGNEIMTVYLTTPSKTRESSAPRPAAQPKFQQTQPPAPAHEE